MKFKREATCIHLLIWVGKKMVTPNFKGAEKHVPNVHPEKEKRRIWENTNYYAPIHIKGAYVSIRKISKI